MRRLPVLPTLLVMVAVGIMIRLGFWQLDRLHQKEAALATYTSAESNPEVISLTSFAAEDIKPLGYRKVALECRASGAEQLLAGRSAKGEPGWGHVVPCAAGSGHGVRHYALVTGWSKDMRKGAAPGGMVTGVLVPGPEGGIAIPDDRAYPRADADFHVVADPPIGGLDANAAPDPKDIPNNHLSYAVQWFLFALTASVIYVVAVRKRMRP